MRKIFISLIFNTSVILFGQVDGSIDSSFNPLDLGNGSGDGTNIGIFNSTTFNNENNILIGGDFVVYNALNRYKVSFLKSDGLNDQNFSSPTVNGAVYCSVKQSDGKIIIAGNFTSVNSTSRNRIARLNINGSLDLSFNPGTGFNGIVRCLCISTNGTFLAGGSFTSYNGNSAPGLIRIQTDGSIMTTFTPSGTSNIYAIQEISNNGGWYIGGAFTGGFRKINLAGSVSSSFNVGSGFSGTVKSILIQPDGKIIVGGAFSQYNGVIKNNLVRLNTDATIDSNFIPGVGSNLGPNGTVNTIVMNSFGKIIIGGQFVSFSGNQVGKIAQINTNGTIDLTFSGAGFVGEVYHLNILSNGKIIACGVFSSYNNKPKNNICKINTDGSNDETFNSLIGINGRITSYVKTTKIYSNNKIILGGEFYTYNNIMSKRLVRIELNGQIDTTFNIGIGLDSTVNTIEIQQDDKILVGGCFTSYNLISSNRIIRLNNDGTVDPSFTVGSGFNGDVHKIICQSDGKILVGGKFTMFNGINVNRLVRLNIDGSIDMSFFAGGFNNDVNDIDVQADGKIIVCGSFTLYNNSSVKRIIRLLTNGQKDNNFLSNGVMNLACGSSIDNAVIHSAIIQSDNNILIGGMFDRIGNYQITGIGRLKTNGNVDSSFNNVNFDRPGYICTIPTIKEILLDDNEKILITGDFSYVNNINCNHLSRLKQNGTIDSSFVSTGIKNGVWSVIGESLSIQNDGKIILGGNFTNYDGSGKNRIVRINSSCIPPQTPIISTNGSFDICSGNSITLTSSSSYGNTWSDGSTNQSITVNSAGNYSLIVSNGTCSSASASVQINTVTYPSQPIISINGSLSICPGEEVTLSSNYPAGNVWSTGDTTQSILVNSAGTYNVSVSNGACSISSTPINISLLNTPSTPAISADGPTTFCSGGFVTLTSSSLTGNSWSNGATTQSITVNSSGNYTVTVSNGSCSTTSNPQQINVIQYPIAPIISASGSTSFCPGDSVTLTSNSPNGNTWSTGETSQSINVSLDGSYTVSNNNGFCTSTSNPAVVSLLNAPSIPVITANGLTSFCQGDSVVLTSNSSTGNLWSTGATSQSIIVNTSGNYNLSVSNGTCSTLSNSVQINVTSYPITPNVSASGPTTFCEGDSVVLTSSNPTYNIWSNNETTQSIIVNTSGSYSVIVSNGSCSVTSMPINVSVISMPTIITQPIDAQVNIGNTATFSMNTSSGSYQWQMNNGLGFQNISNGGQFSGVTTNTLTVSNTTMLNNNNQFRCLVTNNNCSTLSNEVILMVINNANIEESKPNSFMIIPNPTNDFFYLKTNQNQVGNLFELHDIYGRIIILGKITSDYMLIDASTMSSGIYSLKIQGQNQQTTRLVKN
jgi:uncharacterized delta-60 repeat protein